MKDGEFYWADSHRCTANVVAIASCIGPGRFDRDSLAAFTGLAVDLILSDDMTKLPLMYQQIERRVEKIVSEGETSVYAAAGAAWGLQAGVAKAEAEGVERVRCEDCDEMLLPTDLKCPKCGLEYEAGTEEPESKAFKDLLRWRGRQLLGAKTVEDRHRVFVQLMSECLLHIVNKPAKKHNHPTTIDHVLAFTGADLAKTLVDFLQSRKLEDWTTFLSAAMEGMPLEQLWTQYEPLIQNMMAET